jgi:tetratricopeptide (TPR) repeat protein
LEESVNYSFDRWRIAVAAAIVLASFTCRLPAKREQGQISAPPTGISIDYPAQGSIFPPEFPAPVFLWRDPDSLAVRWTVTITFADDTAALLKFESAGERIRIGESDPRCVSSSNEPPSLTPEQAAAHTWLPDSATWAFIKKHSIDRPATVTITGFQQKKSSLIVSRGQVSLKTSRDSVGAPIFYRDVPLMPSENKKGVIKPLAPQSMPLIAWRLRNVGDRESRVVMKDMHTCANCHSFSTDGKILGMDMDGPLNDKGLYAVVKVEPRMTIRNEDLIAWSTFRGKLGSRLRVGFMSQISPDGRYVVTSVNDPGIEQSDYERRKDPKDLVRNYYVANFRDYRFLQVFYPTRGILAWYNASSGRLTYLPGADDTRYVHTNAVWSPDGRYLVFARAAARDAYPEGVPAAQFANDSNETQIRYDLFRIPFSGGKGGTAIPVEGASQNGMSNTFPKISPDGRWIVFVQCRNGMLMRPDGQLYIVPAGGGTARRMKCNTSLMNSWHSFSPNSRWMVFSSKCRTPYTQMFLTHIDESGDDSPPILIENATAANRAVNIPEFVNIPPDGIEYIETPAADYAKYTDRAVELMKNRQYEDAIPEWGRAIALAPKESWLYNSLGVALVETGKVDDAIRNYREALALNPHYWEAYDNLGEALVQKGNDVEAIRNFESALRLNPKFTVARANLGLVLVRSGQMEKAVFHLRKVVEEQPDASDNRRNLGHALAELGRFDEAAGELGEAVRLTDAKDPLALHLLGMVYADLNRREDAIRLQRLALGIATQTDNAELAQAISAQLGKLLTTR